MPCHVEEIGRSSNDQIETLITIIDGKISFKNVGDTFYGKYPTIKELKQKFDKEYKTFHYKASGGIFVMITPCPFGC